MAAADLVRMLNGLFSEFDRLAIEHGVEKIKTVGDNFMLAGGLPEPRPDHGHPYRRRRGRRDRHPFVYDVWGDRVNIASRMESHGMAGRIHVSADTHRHLVRYFHLEPRGAVEIKGKDPMETFLLLGRRLDA